MQRIPNHLDDPPQLLLWEADEFMIIAFAIGLGVVSGFMTASLLGGVAVSKVYARLKDRRPRGFLAHLAYWYSGLGGSTEPAGTRPLPFVRDYH